MPSCKLQRRSRNDAIDDTVHQGCESEEISVKKKLWSSFTSIKFENGFSPPRQILKPPNTWPLPLQTCQVFHKYSPNESKSQIFLEKFLVPEGMHSQLPYNVEDYPTRSPL